MIRLHWRISVSDRFFAQYEPCPMTGCWLWTGAVAGDYGQICVDGHRIKAHVFAYEREFGAVPDGLELDHLCRVTVCVNPAHLEAVTHRENMLRGHGPVAKFAARTRCHRCGGELSKRSDRGRRCADCKREQMRISGVRRTTRRAAARALLADLDAREKATP